MSNIFSEEKIEQLKEYQNNGMFHPYTCGGPSSIKECKRNLSYKRRDNEEEIEYSPENEGVLIPTKDGWVCPCGKYTQTW